MITEVPDLDHPGTLCFGIQHSEVSLSKNETPREFLRLSWSNFSSADTCWASCFLVLGFALMRAVPGKVMSYPYAQILKEITIFCEKTQGLSNLW